MATPLLSSSLLAPLISSAAMRAVVDDRARLQRMLDFEAALARAEAALGVIPATAAKPIADACGADGFDIAAIGEEAALAGNVAIPLVKALTAKVAQSNAEAAGYVHWGATSQDVIDTAQVLELCAAIGVRRCRPASMVKPAIARSRSAANTSMASRNSRTCAVSMTSWLVAPQCT